MSDLKPCPFCGGTEIKMYSFGSSDLHGFSHLCKINGEVMVKVESRFFKTEEEAAEVWNRRAGNVPDTNVGDTISRQEAIDAFWKMDIELRPSAIDAITDMLKTLPSAQPEIIRCKECKHSEHWYKDKRRCFLWHETGIDVFEDGYCNYADMREGQDG